MNEFFNRRRFLLRLTLLVLPIILGIGLFVYKLVDKSSNIERENSKTTYD